jgi:hypothetical protein
LGALRGRGLSADLTQRELLSTTEQATIESCLSLTADEGSVTQLKILPGNKPSSFCDWKYFQ